MVLLFTLMLAFIHTLFVKGIVNSRLLRLHIVHTGCKLKGGKVMIESYICKDYMTL